MEELLIKNYVMQIVYVTMSKRVSKTCQNEFPKLVKTSFQNFSYSEITKTCNIRFYWTEELAIRCLYKVFNAITFPWTLVLS